MKYEGKLYGKVGRKHFDTGKTSHDWDELEMCKTQLLVLVNMAEDALCEALVLESGETARKRSEEFFFKLGDYRKNLI